MDELEKKLRFGKVVVLQDTPQGTGYAGRRLKQLADYSFEYSMTDYAENRLAMVKLKEKVLKKDAAKVKLDEDGITQLRGAVASINWTAREGRPDASASASILSGVFPEPTVADAQRGRDYVEEPKGYVEDPLHRGEGHQARLDSGFFV